LIPSSSASAASAGSIVHPDTCGALRKQTIQEYARSHNADAVVLLQIFELTAPWRQTALNRLANQS
jgi:hypothetical protein